MTVFRTVLEPTGGNNVGIVVPEEIVLGFDRRAPGDGLGSSGRRAHRQ
ncbi:hypothetical protein GCM10011512_24680 [Tersicoccus solisilvae]|uniref:Uncharacterized protein n=1 Tax=Tersicoccus solisilvae TaxID=1882339 RepID=A0ABQ1PGM6_9MICC|nr:hypothetical protein [Tersicoccus solisilvae]GGC96720.1 hypothetical protein GCM10011512_24680 [Tersicoccus solisilvae]